MAYTEANSNPRSEIVADGFFDILVARFIAWRSYRNTYKALSRLSDAELDDIGINRGDIESISRGAI